MLRQRGLRTRSLENTKPRLIAADQSRELLYVSRSSSKPKTTDRTISRDDGELPVHVNHVEVYERGRMAHTPCFSRRSFDSKARLVRFLEVLKMSNATDVSRCSHFSLVVRVETVFPFAPSTSNYAWYVSSESFHS
jgi:hypothetical protein